MRFRPKNFTFTKAWDFEGTGFGVSELMKREEAGPLPPLISGAIVSHLVEMEKDLNMQLGMFGYGLFSLEKRV